MDIDEIKMKWLDESLEGLGGINPYGDEFVERILKSEYKKIDLRQE